MGFQKPLDITSRLVPIDRHNHGRKGVHAPIRVGGQVGSRPRPLLVERGRKQGVVDRRAPGGIPDEIVPVATFQLIPAE